MPIVITSLAANPTGGNLVDAVRDYLGGGTRAVLNELAGDIDAATPYVVLSRDVGPISAGDTLSIGIETMYVWSYNNDSRVAEVRRGVEGSSASDHVGQTLVRVNPRWTDYTVFKAINESINALNSSGLFVVAMTTGSISATSAGLALPAGFSAPDSLLDVYWQPLSYIEQWTPVTDYSIVMNVSLGDYPTGKALFPVGVTHGQPVRIRYKSEFNQLVGTDDFMSSTGLAESQQDLPILGAASRLTAGIAISRSNPFIRPQRENEDVTVTDALQAGGAIRALFDARIAEEIIHQQNLYPAVRKMRTLMGHGYRKYW